MNIQRIISLLETIIDEYGARDMRTYHTVWKLEPIEDQNPEIQEAMLVLEELKKNVSQKS